MGFSSSSILDAVYRHEIVLSRVISGRYRRIVSRYGFRFLRLAQDIYETKLRQGCYGDSDVHPLPSDPLVCFDEDAVYWPFLRLRRRKFNIVVLEVFKQFRRGKTL